MPSNLATWIRKAPLLAFYLLAFAITWLAWFPQAAYARGLFPFDSFVFYILGGIGPLLAVSITSKALQSRFDFGELFRPLFQWRVSFVWYAVALLLPLAVTVATLALSGGFTAHFSKFGAPLAILTSFLSYLLAAIPEEIAWRGFALPRLQARHNALTASLIVGLLWAIWHLPLLLNTNNSMSTYPIGLFVVDVLADSIIYAWIYNNTRGSLLFVTLFHAVGNTIGTFTGIESVLVNVALALVIVLVFGATHLSRSSKRPTEDSAPIEPIPAD